MKLLISPVNEMEALEAIRGGADIIDVKNPKEGALGANYPWIIKSIKELTPKRIQVSCTLGEIPNLPGSISLAALGAASLGVDYIKIGLSGLKEVNDAIVLLSNVNRAVKEYNPQVKVVAVGYADAIKFDGLDPLIIPEIAKKTGADVAMVDTAIKCKKNLLDYLSIKQLEVFVESSHVKGIEVALAGSLRKQDLPLIYSLGADIAGLRGAACTNSDRVEGIITRKLVKELVETVRKAEGQIKVERA